jgi:glycosyltransferase involved in cell wall biosynthesis
MRVSADGRTFRPAPRLLFLNQGRASSVGVMGHLQLEAALKSGLPPESQEACHFERLRPWNTADRVLKKRFPALKGKDWGVARWMLLRSLATRKHLSDARLRGIEGAHVTAHAVALLTTRRSPLAVTLSVDTTLWDWQVLLRKLALDSQPARDMAVPLFLEHRAFTEAALVHAWTATVADQVRRLAPAANIVQLHPGVDLNRFRPGDRTSRPLRVLFVGGRFAEKGGWQLIDALAPRLGDDVMLDVVTTEAVEPPPGVRVRRLSPGSAELASAFREADVFCLPSRADAVPWVVLEAMASGTPVVASDVGSVKEMVGEGGVVIPRGDLNELRQALDGLLDDADSRRRAGAAARARVETHYDAKIQAPKLLSAVTEATVQWQMDRGHVRPRRAPAGGHRGP